MITMNELVDLRMQQQLAHEILYRQQIMQRIPDPFAAMMPAMHMPAQMLVPSHPPLPGVEAKLENNDLWQQFHKIGTEMIITKCGRRMFPSMRASLRGLEEDSQYCVLIEMVPIGDCRYKFSGSQWVPAGGAEPQSPQRIYLHPDSPAAGSHWQAQPILFNKVKLTNNTLDNNGHIVLASMHKYQPRIHVIRTNDLSQIPWAAQQAFVFPETEFIAVTAYQNDRITKLKIDNNPFAKGFRETGQSKCKRKTSLSPDPAEEHPTNYTHSDDDQSSVASSQGSPQTKRLCVREEFRPFVDSSNGLCYALQPPSLHDLIAPAFFSPLTQQAVSMLVPSGAGYLEPLSMMHRQPYQQSSCSAYDFARCHSVAASRHSDEQSPEFFVDVVSTSSEDSQESVGILSGGICATPPSRFLSCDEPVKRSSFSISSILGGNTRGTVSV